MFDSSNPIMADIVLLYSIADNTIIYKTDTVSLYKKKQVSNLMLPTSNPIPSFDFFRMHIETINIEIYVITEIETP